MCDPIWQVTLRSCEMVFHEQLYNYLYWTSILYENAQKAFSFSAMPPGALSQDSWTSGSQTQILL